MKIKQHLYKKEKVLEFQYYMFAWLLSSSLDQVIEKDMREIMIEPIYEYNKIFDLEVGE